MSEIKARPQPVTVTESAARRIKAIIAAESKPGLKLRISVSGGGCSGFQYGFALDEKGEPDDILVEKDGAAVVVDGMSLMYVLGSQLDFVEDLTGSYFRVSNPNATSSCGCGSSFAI
jgi:iron-sulfur cluster insertion protein